MAPLNPTYDICRLATAGADGFYFGYIPERWLNYFNNGYFLNRRGHRLDVNFLSHNVKNTIESCHKYNKLAFAVFNNHQYTSLELKIIKDSILKLKDIKIDGVIASDINIIEFCSESDIPLHLSTCATTYNRYSCEFYNQLGVNHIILPRDISLSEMENIIKYTSAKIEYEAFIYNSPCRFSECVCLSNHGMYGNICKRIKYEKQCVVDRVSKRPYIDYYRNHKLGSCALCMIYKMKNIGVKWLKIVERTLPFEAIVDSCYKVKYAVQQCERFHHEEEYMHFIMHREGCHDHLNCYYK